MRFLPAIPILTMAAGLLSLAGVAQAELRRQPLEYQQGQTRLQGYLAYDDAASGKRPGVLVVHEWWGLNDYARRRAEQLAQLGYVALAVDMYGEGRTTTDPKQAGTWAGQVMKDRALAKARLDAALEQLKRQPQTDPSRLAAIGYCFGGTMVLNYARAGADLAGVASFHGNLKTDAPAQPGQIKAKILVLHGGDDPMVPPADVEAFRQEMNKAGADCTLIVYPGAVHAFSNPDADKPGIKGVSYNAEADRKSWEELQSFFKQIFAAPSAP